MYGSSTTGFRISAAQFVRQFAECRGRADREPVFIASYGRTTHALIGIEHFESLHHAAQEGRAEADHGLAGALLADMGAWLDFGLIVCDEVLRVETINPAAAAIAGVVEGALAGRPFAEVFPAAQGSVLASHVERVAASRAPSTAEFPSPFAQDCWLRLRAFWWKDRVVLLLSDITAEVRRDRLADENASVVDAFSALPSMTHARLSQRGTIDSAHPTLPEMLGLAPERLAGVAFADLLDLGARPAFRTTLEAALQGETPAPLATRLISNRGSTISVEAAMAPLVGSYGVEGVVVVIGADGTDSRLSDG